MPSEPRHTHDSPAPTNGPDLLEERSIAGILVHFLAIPTGAVGAGLVYLAATNEFTRRNARNALDWHLAMLGLTVLTFGSFVAYAEVTDGGVGGFVVLPGPASTTVGLLVPALVACWMLASAWTFVVGLLAMGKAVSGTAWRYPLSPRLVDGFGPRVAGAGSWTALLVVYVVATPAVLALVFLGLEGSAAFWVTLLGVTGLVAVLTPLAVIALYVHGHRDRPADARWRPQLLAYLGGPVAVATVGYWYSATATGSINPAGDAVYVFVSALWLAALGYLLRWKTVSQ
ncbi:DUF4870 domain-containing protein [Halobaculum lipolyticum]|uniref:DUF4870 domain-containing protein n=1 Tax=Halobaculum lipolyticum TaxID=3032001 RepID=A0ABD5W682_9EURY|nr:DUF4870 domain-containing protein [Halobaculum sp. DT31]